MNVAINRLPNDTWHLWMSCPKCEGSGGYADRWNEDEQRWESYVCGSCGGSGAVTGYFDSKDEAKRYAQARR